MTRSIIHVITVLIFAAGVMLVAEIVGAKFYEEIARLNMEQRQ